jgi:hypothetical protein
MKTPLPLRRLIAGLRAHVPPSLLISSLLIPLLLLASPSLRAQNTAPQQLVFTGLRASSNPTGFYAQFNAVQSDSSGNIYLLLDQKDGIRLLKTDPTATSVLAQAQLGASGDIGLAMALDPSGNIYITGTTTSGALTGTSGAAFPSAADTSTNTFIGKFDANLNEIFLTFAGSPRTTASSIAATADAVFLTGSIFGATLPVTPSGIIQLPAAGSLQNGFVEKFNATGTTLLYATYLSGQNGDTAPSAITADAADNAYITGYTTSSGFPTLAAVVPTILSPTSGFLTKLTPAGDGILFSTFIPGPGLTSIAIDPATQTLLLSGTIALGQFPILTVTAPLADTPYQTLLRMPLDGSTVLASTLFAPGTQSTLNPTTTGATWITGTSTIPASLLPLTPLSTIGNSYALRVNAQTQIQFQIDQTLRLGGLPTTNPNFASAPVTLTSLTTDPTGQPIFAGSASPTASASLLSTETYDLPLYNSPTATLPSNLRAAVLPTADCAGSLCSGTAAYLAKLNPTIPAPSLALSSDNAPNLTLRNLGSDTATNLQLTAQTIATDCPTTLTPGAECNIVLTSPNPGTLTIQADNATTQTIALPASTTAPNPIVFSPKELDFGIVTSNSPAATRTLTVTNLSQQAQTFPSTLGSNQATPYTFAESSSDCPISGLPTTKSLAPDATCHITLSLTAASSPAGDSFAQSNWTLAAGTVLLTGYTQAAALYPSAAEIDFGTQFPGTPHLPRDLYLSNNSVTAISHTPVTLASPFTLIDLCPTTLKPHTVCQLQLTYESPIAPSADTTTLTLDQSISILITGTTLPQPTDTGQSVNPNLTLNPATVTFPNAVPVTSTSSTTQTVTIGNTGAQPFALTLALTGDFTDTTNCPANLPANQTCVVILTFAPSQPGTRQGLLSVTAGNASAPAFVSLNGTGTAILPSGSTLDFGNVLVGQPAVQWYKLSQSFTALTASTPAPNFAAILVEDIGYGHGQPPTTAFAATYTSPCSNCWLGVQFTPTQTGPQAATLNLSSSASGNPSPITLTGTGLPSTGLLLTPTLQDFGPIPVNSLSPPALFTLTNQTPAAITLTAPTVTGDFTLSPAPTGGPACTGTLAPGASCFTQIVFSPTATGPRTGSILLQTSASTLTAPLTGSGAPDTGLSLAPTALIFNNVPGATATQQTITLTNTGSSSLQVATPTTATSSFAAATTCTTLAPAAACTITVTFTPTDAAITDTLQLPVTSSTTGLTTYTVPLTGAYTAEDSGLQILPAQSEYGPSPTGTLGETRQFTINNLTAKSLALSLSLPRQFTLSTSASNDCATLAPNASCAFSATFLPLTNGDITGTISAQATPTDGSAPINGLGNVEGYGTGAGALAITGNIIPNTGVLNFGQVPSGQSSPQTLTLTNQGASPITVRRITTEWPFLASATTCGAPLSSSQSCTVTLAYTPLNQLATGTTSPQPTSDAATLVIESDALTSPDTIDLTGTAAPILLSAPSNNAPLVSYTTSAGSLTFSSTQVGNASPPQTVTLTNTGTTTLHIATLQTTPDFTVEPLQNICATILPGDTCPLTVTFTPQAASPIDNSSSNRIGALQITSDASTALDFISLFGAATPAALTLTPLALNFTTTPVGSSTQLPLLVTNTSVSAAIFNGIVTTGDYAATGTCPTPGNALAASASCTVEVTFTPTQAGPRTGTLSVATSLSTLPLTAALTGIGSQSHLQITPASLNFGSVPIGASANLTFTLANTGTATITNLIFTTTGDYAITTPCAFGNLAPEATCSITVTFTPTALGSLPGNLNIVSSDDGSPNHLPLTGTGTPRGTFLLTANGASTASATVALENPATYNLQLIPQANYSGTVVLNCTPINPGQYATCSLLPSSITLNGTTQTATATINTITTSNPNTASHSFPNTQTSNQIVLCILPAALLFLRRRGRRTYSTLWTILFTASTLLLAGCGSGDIILLRTPPGTYQYQVTATSTSGVAITQTVTLNLTVQ